MNETSKKDKSAEPYTNDNSIETYNRSKAGSRLKNTNKRKAGITVKPTETTKKAFEELHSPHSEKNQQPGGNLEQIKETMRESKVDKQDNSKVEKSEEDEEKKKKYYGHVLVFIIILVIIFEYYTYVFEIKLRNLKSTNMIATGVCLVLFHIFFFLMLWSLIVTMGTHPGEIPLYWVNNKS